METGKRTFCRRFPFSQAIYRNSWFFCTPDTRMPGTRIAPGQRYTRLSAYANLSSDQDTRVSQSLGMQQEIGQIGSGFGAAASFIEPEILKIDSGQNPAVHGGREKAANLQALLGRSSPTQSAHGNRRRGKNNRPMRESWPLRHTTLQHFLECGFSLSFQSCSAAGIRFKTGSRPVSRPAPDIDKPLRIVKKYSKPFLPSE